MCVGHGCWGTFVILGFIVFFKELDGSQFAMEVIQLFANITCVNSCLSGTEF